MFENFPSKRALARTTIRVNIFCYIVTKKDLMQIETQMSSRPEQIESNLHLHLLLVLEEVLEKIEQNR